MVERERAVGRVVEERVVDRPRPLGLDLVHAGDEPDPELARARAEALLGRRADRDRVLRDARERLLRAGVLPAGERLRPPRRRIDRHERLGEDDELGSVARGLGGETLELVERPLAIEDDRLRLDAGDRDGAIHTGSLVVARAEARAHACGDDRRDARGPALGRRRLRLAHRAAAHVGTARARARARARPAVRGAHRGRLAVGRDRGGGVLRRLRDRCAPRLARRSSPARPWGSRRSRSSSRRCRSRTASRSCRSSSRCSSRSRPRSRSCRRSRRGRRSPCGRRAGISPRAPSRRPASCSCSPPSRRRSAHASPALLAVYPLYSAVLAAFAHRLEGRAAAVGLLRGLLVGLFSFTAFYSTLAILLPAHRDRRRVRRSRRRRAHGAGGVASPHPPPPGVSIRTRSPARSAVVTFAGCSSPLTSVRPGAPSPPPAAPFGAWRAALREHGEPAVLEDAQLAHDAVAAAVRARAARALAQLPALDAQRIRRARAPRPA